MPVTAAFSLRLGHQSNPLPLAHHPTNRFNGTRDY
jgi:hypothetical protein